MTVAFRFLALTASLPIVLYAGIALSTDGRQAFADWWQTAQDRERLQEDGELVQANSKAMEAVVVDLIEGRLSLPEAAAALRALNEERPPNHRIHLDEYPGESAEERSLWWTLARAEAIFGYDSRKEEIERRLRTELREGLDAVKQSGLFPHQGAASWPEERGEYGITPTGSRTQNVSFEARDDVHFTIGVTRESGPTGD